MSFPSEHVLAVTKTQDAEKYRTIICGKHKNFLNLRNFNMKNYGKIS